MAETEPEALEAEGQLDLEAEDRPDFLEANFKTVEDQARAYSAARGEMKRAQEDRKRAEDFASDLAAQMEAAPPQNYQGQDQGSHPLVERMEQAMMEGDANTVLAIQAYVSEQAAQAAIARANDGRDPAAEASTAMFSMMVEKTAREIVGDDEAWAEVEEDVGEMLRENPGYLRNSSDPTVPAHDLARLVQMVRAMKGTAPTRANPEETRGFEGALRDSGLPADQRKRLAQTLSGAGARILESADDDQAYYDRVKAATPDEWTGR
jgi:hypothetical protein